MAKSKNGKMVSNLDGVNADLKASFESVLNLEAELKAYELAVSMLNLKKISVRGLKATIEASLEIGSMPTIKPTTAQYFLVSSQVRALSGGVEHSLKDILNTTIQAKRAFGKDFQVKLAEAISFEAFADSVPSQGERANAGRGKGEALVTADAVISFFIGSISELEDITPSDSAQWDKFLKVVGAMTKARANAVAGAKSRHASARVKANA